MTEIKVPKSDWVKMTNATRRTIVRNVIQKLYSKKINDITEEMQKIANGANRQMYPVYFKLRDNPKTANYVYKYDSTFYFRVNAESVPSSMDRPCANRIPDDSNKALTVAPRLELHRAITVTGPGTRWDNELKANMPDHPTIPVPNKTFLNKITKILAERDALIEEFNTFSQELFASVHRFTYVKELYDYLPELKELTGVAEYKSQTPSYPVVISTATMMTVIQNFLKNKEVAPVEKPEVD